MEIQSVKTVDPTTRLTLLDDYPRSMGNPRQNYVAFNREQRDRYIQKYIKQLDLYMSVYKFTEFFEDGTLYRPSAYVDKVFFDLDSENWLRDITKIYHWCLKLDIINRNQMSGRGGHAFIFVDPNLENPKSALGNFQRWIARELELKVDPKIIGDTSRIFRYPNTYNYRMKRYCIPMPSAAINLDMPERWWFKRAKKQQYDNAWSGHRLLDISEWDVPEMLYAEHIPSNINFGEIDYDIETEYPDFPPCAQLWLSTPYLCGEGKFYLVLFLKDQLYTDVPFDYKEIVAILRKTLSPQEAKHYFGSGFMRGHAGHLGKKFKTVMMKDYYMPNCEEIRKKGYCPQNCGRRNPIYN